MLPLIICTVLHFGPINAVLLNVMLHHDNRHFPHRQITKGFSGVIAPILLKDTERITIRGRRALADASLKRT